MLAAHLPETTTGPTSRSYGSDKDQVSGRHIDIPRQSKSPEHPKLATVPFCRGQVSVQEFRQNSGRALRRTLSPDLSSLTSTHFPIHQLFLVSATRIQTSACTGLFMSVSFRDACFTQTRYELCQPVQTRVARQNRSAHCTSDDVLRPLPCSHNWEFAGEERKRK